MDNTTALVQVYPDGIHHGIPEDEYHALPRLSQSSIKDILRSPAHYRYGERKETAAMRKGTAVDIAITEPQRLESYFHIVPDDLRMDPRTAAYKAAVIEAGDKALIKRKDYDHALRIRDAVLAHETVGKLIDGAQAQPVALWTERTAQGPVRCKARLDWANEGARALLDLKTTVDARKFGLKAEDMGYDIQGGFYTHGWMRAGGWEPEGFVFAVVETGPYPGIRCIELDAHDYHNGRDLALHGVAVYAGCRERDEWPGYLPGIECISLRPWYRDRVELLLHRTRMDRAENPDYQPRK